MIRDCICSLSEVRDDIGLVEDGGNDCKLLVGDGVDEEEEGGGEVDILLAVSSSLLLFVVVIVSCSFDSK